MCPPYWPQLVLALIAFILDRCMTILSGVFHGASSKSVLSMAFAFKHALVCSLASSMTEHAWRSLRGGQTLWWHPCHDRQTLWVSLPLSACALYDHMYPGPDGACGGSGFGGRGRPCAFYLLTGSLAPLAALFSTAWTSIRTDNFISRNMCIPACMCACMLKVESEPFMLFLFVCCYFCMF